ncbi:MAG: DUF3303 family protein [SAR324 cluster bacterium]|nr:DUF3303 family protein [SAR324 cluster bacterium]
MLYMVIETFKDDCAAQVYERFRERGRMTPPGLEYIESWVDADVTRCFQLMKCDNPALLEQWMEHWWDLTDFEVVPVIDSKQAMAKVLP